MANISLIDIGFTDVVIASISFSLEGISFVENLTLGGTADLNGTGNDLNNLLTGNSGANVLSGRGGNDTIIGGLGADTMLGGSGSDLYFVNSVLDVVRDSSGRLDVVHSTATHVLSENVEILTLTGTAHINGTGNALANTLTGNGGRNALDGAAGHDTVFGQDGDDRLYGRGGNDLLFGGAGDDAVYGGGGRDHFVYENSAGGDFLYGGAGADRFDDVEGDNRLSGGDGADIFLVRTDSGFNTASGGTGVDEYVLWASALEHDYVVTDFQAGVDGDLIDVSDLLGHSTQFGYGGGDPIGEGFLRLRQSGAAALIQWDADGPDGTAYTWTTQLEMTGFSAAAFAADQLTGIPPAAPSAGNTLVGDGAVDSLVGGLFDDELSGLDGPDTLDGRWGDDILYGGGGQDLLAGGSGNDTMYGGDGNDHFEYEAALGDDRLVGGPGDDSFEDFEGHNVLIGGDGADLFHVSVNTRAFDVGGSTVSGGSGRDEYRLAAADTSWDYVVTDFDAGDGGDLIDASALLAISRDHGSGNGSVEEVLRLRQAAGTTHLQWDRDGANAAFDWVTVLTLRNVDASTLTENNFAGKLVIGSDSDDDLLGSIGNDVIQGLGGNDTLDGSAGADSMEGGEGNDIYYVDESGDFLKEVQVVAIPEDPPPIGVKYIGDTVIAAINYALKTNFENLVLAGRAVTGTGNDVGNLVNGNARNNTLAGLGGGDTIEGQEGDDTLVGGSGLDTVSYKSADSGVRVSLGETGAQNTQGAGVDTIAGFERVMGSAYGDRLTGDGDDNVLAGLRGSDTLTGGGGSDTFDFTTGLNQTTDVDRITDFTTGVDEIRLDRTIFAEISIGALAEAAFHNGSAAGDAGDRIIYDAGTGNLYYDRDGTGDAAAKLFAVVAGGVPVAAGDFFVVT